MKILLVAGNEHSFVSGYLLESHKAVIVNKNGVMLHDAAEYLKEHPTPLNHIVITDGGLSADPDQNSQFLEYLREITDSGITVITRDFLFDATSNSVKIIQTRWFRAIGKDFDTVFDFRSGGESAPSKKQLGGRKRPVEIKNTTHQAGNKAKTRKWGKAKLKTEEDEDPPAVSVASSRAIVFTGHRGSGATSTSVNVAITASRRGVNTMLIDLDVDYRSTNLYFGEYYTQAEEDEYVASSLIRTLAQPQSYQTTAVNIESNLWLTTLGYDFNDKSLIERHFTESKIIGLITALKHSFDLVVVDIPLDSLARFPALLNSIDVVSLCMENTVYSAITTLRNISLGFTERERIAYLASKSKLVVTKYNDESVYNDEIITPERLSELIISEGFSEDFEIELPVAGSVPYISWFGKQIESDIPVMEMEKRMEEAYEGILLRLIG